ncbi:hypothetical protein [Kocuria sp. HSID16901]|uniref:hypothetical protein n=1 Tax=Kocuria sp. HSID16901 TaxID=2419505 RepID=UPI00069E1FDC|nr:hypothetical protein [Kocuria sp. HSID16901]RUQ22580.1 hypothetical protein D8M21_03915 [Kocuria sp. HSID16901]
MTDYALNDRGSLELVTEDYYDAEILRLFDGKRLDREQVVDATAQLVPEPDNPVFPESIAIWVNGYKVARMTVKDSERYWNPLARIIYSGYTPVAPIRFWATQRRDGDHPRLETRAILSVSRPELLFPINASPLHAALLPQGSSVKVLNENEHAEYLHDVLPMSGEGRVILTLEANRHKLADGSEVEVVDVLHDRRIVGRLSTQMSEQLAPVVRYAFQHNKLTAVWGTIRGSSFELSLTVQTVRADEIPSSWYTDLPNSLPLLKAKQDSYDLDPSYVPSEAEENPSLKRAEKPDDAVERLHPDTHGSSSATKAGFVERHRHSGGSGWGLGVLGALILILGIVLIFFKPILGVLGIIVGASVVFAGVYMSRFQGSGRMYDQIDINPTGGPSASDHEPQALDQSEEPEGAEADQEEQALEQRQEQEPFSPNTEALDLQESEPEATTDAIDDVEKYDESPEVNDGYYSDQYLSEEEAADFEEDTEPSEYDESYSYPEWEHSDDYETVGEDYSNGRGSGSRR